VKLLNVNTFESDDYGIGLRQNANTSTLSAAKTKRKRSAATTNRKKSPEPSGAGTTGETPSDPSSMKLLVRHFYLMIINVGPNKIFRDQEVRENFGKLGEVQGVMFEVPEIVRELDPEPGHHRENRH
jgi:hypothetical protein